MNNRSNDRRDDGRREGSDRRKSQVPIELERRKNNDRRNSNDRRSSQERRHD